MTQELDAFGVTSATIFHSPMKHPYVLCTTAPSSERGKHGGEWTYISAIGDGPATVPECLEDNLSHLAKHGAIMAGAVSELGNVVGLLKKSGRLLIVPLNRASGGYGVRGDGTIKVKDKLYAQTLSQVDPTCLRFHVEDGVQHLVAVDIEGKVVVQRLDERSDQSVSSMSSWKKECRYDN